MPETIGIYKELKKGEEIIAQVPEFVFICTDEFEEDFELKDIGRN